MKAKASYKIGMSVLLSIVVGLSGSVLLGACDASNGSGCDGGGDLPPQVEDTRTMVPHSSWNCSMPDGIPSPENGVLVFEADMTLGNIHDMGQTQYGRRFLIEVTGGTVSGPKVTAEFLKGGLDYQLLTPGSAQLDARYTIETTDGELIIIRNCGRGMAPVPMFETNVDSKYSYLNDGLWLSSAPKPSTGSVAITIFESVEKQD